MKNISRRVFIKGLAVAGVAAAASTVLAGCNTNMIPGVDDGADSQPETPSTSKVMTWADPTDSKKTLSVTLKSATLGDDTAFAGANKNKVSITALVENDMGSNLFVVMEDTAFVAGGSKGADGDYYVLVEAYANDRETNVGTVAKSGLVADTSTNFVTSAIGDGKYDEDTIVVDFTTVAAKEDIKKVTLKLTVGKILAVKASDTVREPVYTQKLEYTL